MPTSIRAVALGAGLALAPPASAAPWIRPPGETYTKAGVHVFHADLPAGETLRYRAVTWLAQGEIGVLPGLELSFDLPYVAASHFDGVAAYSNHALADARLRLSFAVLPAVPFSVGLEAKLPLYRTVAQTAPAGIVRLPQGPYPASSFPEVGDGAVELAPRVYWGRSFYPAPAWVTAMAGYRKRFGAFADGVELEGNLGGFVHQDRVGFGLFAGALFAVGADPNPLIDFTREHARLGACLFGVPLGAVKGLTVQLSGGLTVWATGGAPGSDLGFGISYLR